MQEFIRHRKGGALLRLSGPVAVDTFASRIHVDWNPDAAAAPPGHMPFFIEFLHFNVWFGDWVARYPLECALQARCARYGIVVSAIGASTLRAYQCLARRRRQSGVAYEQSNQRGFGAAWCRPV